MLRRALSWAGGVALGALWRACVVLALLGPTQHTLIFRSW